MIKNISLLLIGIIVILFLLLMFIFLNNCNDINLSLCIQSYYEMLETGPKGPIGPVGPKLS